MTTPNDNVNNPAHYQFSNGAQVIDITENLSFNLGNVVKYVARAGRKTDDPIEDLRKAQFYLNREIERLATAGAVEYTLSALYGMLYKFWEFVTGPRLWDLLDNVPPGVIVEDVDGDYYRRISGTAKFEFACRRCSYGQHYEWQDMPPFMYRESRDYGPFKEVST